MPTHSAILFVCVFLNRVGVLHEEYDACIKLGEKEHNETLEQTHYQVFTCSFALIALNFHALLIGFFL